MEYLNELVINKQYAILFPILKKELPDKSTNILMQQASLAELDQQVGMGLLSIGESKKHYARINLALYDLIKLVTNQEYSNSPKSEPTMQSKNKITQFNELFESLKKDFNNMEYNKSTCYEYVNGLNGIFESTIFNPFMDQLTQSDWNELLNPEKRDRCKSVLNNLILNEDKLRSRILQFVEKQSGTISLDDLLSEFFNSPTIKRWNTLKELLSVRFSDSSLFGEKVTHAFNGWVNKLDALSDEITFSMDFNFDYRSDFGEFLRNNLKPKNFNY